jgi:uncharacterized paraquat-inducible protein A
MAESHTRKRPWLAVVLAALYPGLGHVYLREWFRALLWFGLIITAGVVLIPASMTPEEVSIQSMMAMSRQLPLDAMIAILALTLLSVADAYSLAKRSNRQRRRDPDGDAAPTCPQCGKEIDPELDFCHWCSAELDEVDHDEGRDWSFGLR